MRNSPKKRQDLFRIIEELVKWENITNEMFLEQAREEIRRSWRRTCEDNWDHPRAAELFNPDQAPCLPRSLRRRWLHTPGGPAIGPGSPRQ